MIGDQVLVAPVLHETLKNDIETRLVYLPKGVWIDPFNNVLNITTSKFYNATALLSQIPYFIKQT